MKELVLQAWAALKGAKKRCRHTWDQKQCGSIATPKTDTEKNSCHQSRVKAAATEERNAWWEQRSGRHIRVVIANCSWKDMSSPLLLSPDFLPSLRWSQQEASESRNPSKAVFRSQFPLAWESPEKGTDGFRAKQQIICTAKSDKNVCP